MDTGSLFNKAFSVTSGFSSSTVAPTKAPKQVFILPSDIESKEVNLILDQLPHSDDVTIFIGPEMVVESVPWDEIPEITQEKIDEIPKNSTIVDIYETLADTIDLNETKVIPIIDQSNFLLTDFLQNEDVDVNPIQIQPVAEPEQPVTCDQIKNTEDIDATSIIEKINQNKPALILLPSDFTPKDVVQTIQVY